MFQRRRRLSACFLTALVIALVGQVGECGVLWANRKPSSDVQHWSVVSQPAVGPDGTIYVLCSLGDLLPGSEGFPWTYGPGRNYLYAVRPDGAQKWRFALGGGEIPEGPLFPPKVGPSGTIYVADNHDLYAVDSKGTSKWKFSVASEPSWMDFGSHGTIYFYADKLLHALNPDGTLKWKKSSDAAPMTGPDGSIYITAGSLLYAINPDGTSKWSLAVGKSPIRALRSPQPKSGGPWAIYVIGSDNLYAVAPEGAQKWKFPYTCPPLKFLPPGPCDNTLGFGSSGTIAVPSTTKSGGSLIYALKADGTLKGKFGAQSEICGTRVGPDGAIYVEGGEDTEDRRLRNLYAFKPDSTLKWKWPSEKESEAVMGLGVLEFGPDGALYVEEDWGVHGGCLAAVGADGSKKWQFGLGSFSLALRADGTIYVADNLSGPGLSASGALYALTPSGALKWSFDRLCVGNRDGCPRADCSDTPGP